MSETKVLGSPSFRVPVATPLVGVPFLLADGRSWATRDTHKGRRYCLSPARMEIQVLSGYATSNNYAILHRNLNKERKYPSESYCHSSSLDRSNEGKPKL